jgi:hypothetical protein
MAVSDWVGIGERDRVLVLDPGATGFNVAVRAEIQSGRIADYTLLCAAQVARNDSAEAFESVERSYTGSANSH